MYKDINELDLMNQPDEGDPLVWLRKYREELSEKYTFEELCEHYRNVPPLEEVRAQLKKKIAEKKLKAEQ